MFRYLAFSLCIMLLGLLQACEQGGASQQKIGVVNINRIMVDSDAGKAAAKYMEELQDKLRAQLTELQNRVNQQKNAAGEKKAEENTAQEEALQKEVQMVYGKLQSEQQNVQNILNDILHRTVDKYRKEKGYAMILFSDVVLSFGESVDVTSAVTEAMNAEKVEFKPLPEKATPKPEPAKEASETKQEAGKESGKESSKDAQAK
ncbi:MAG: OmpH family outer membrane protein [Desulfovibrio sp.]|nr:OmpH family outer membrane protein [Desulfovibrio sp.]